MTTQLTEDPRPLLARALDQAGKLVAAATPDELSGPTACTAFDVRALLGHLVSVLHKLALVGTGGDARDVPDVTEGVADDGWASSFAQARGEVDRVWADDEKLDRMTELPWATLPGRGVLDAFTHELTAHSWDLAHATGRLGALDPELSTRALEAYARFLPPEARDEKGPFGPVVPAPEGADVHTRLAAYLGRRA
ncbi:TIGR03086 family metal-binding protein [Streptomyces sp. NPDC051561]|uniref:TIGR03086 family metal-binding protein n=1 Tax=Streptomyces sp. NPDC051561 TaxID=3365658 RepID=UPI0037BDC36F